MIEIKEKDFIAEGGYQKCYVHPKNQNLCIKINTKDIDSSRLGYEIKYSKKVSGKTFKNLDYCFFSKYYGEVTTNLGTGYIYDLIRDEVSGEISKTMAYYLLDKESKFNDTIIQQGFNRLIKVMIQHKVIANDLRSNNICCKILKDNSIEMIIVDGLGHKDTIPLIEWFRFFTRKKINRRIIRHHLNDFDKNRQHLKEINYLDKKF